MAGSKFTHSSGQKGCHSSVSNFSHAGEDVLFRVHLSVSQALAENRPGVVLVSTIITHGMPYPHSVSTAKEVEAIVRGRVHVRLSSELDYLAQSKTSLKVSRQDLPYAISKSGLLLAVPIPEEHAAASQQIGDAIQAALAEAIAKGIRGRDVTSPSSFKRSTN